MAINKELVRRQSKGNDGAFLYELQNSYELSPKVSEQILISKRVLQMSTCTQILYQKRFPLVK